MTHLSLFSGIGGLDLAAEAAGFRTVGQCEWADYPTKILELHWPEVPRWRDIRSLKKESFYERTGLRTVDVISGGFPCQPFSVAGKRRGNEDDRYLWPEMLRVIQELRPAWVVGENVAGIIGMALDQVLSDLDGQGYETKAFVFPACAVDAPHRRDRVCIVGWKGRPEDLLHPNTTSNEYPYIGESKEGTQQQSRSFGLCENVPHSNNVRCEGTGQAPEEGRDLDQIGVAVTTSTNDGAGYRWPSEPNMGRVAHGVPHWVDRLKCLGNAVVPAQFYPIFAAIAQIEKESVT